MKLLFIGHQGFYDALSLLLKDHPGVHLRFGSNTDWSTNDVQHVDIIIIDSQSFRLFMDNYPHKLSASVIVVGHYIDDYAKTAFGADFGFKYIPYSHIELELLPQILG